jgi:hypothetical protein
VEPDATRIVYCYTQRSTARSLSASSRFPSYIQPFMVKGAKANATNKGRDAVRLFKFRSRSRSATDDAMVGPMSFAGLAGCLTIRMARRSWRDPRESRPRHGVRLRPMSCHAERFERSQPSAVLQSHTLCRGRISARPTCLSRAALWRGSQNAGSRND